MISVSPDAASQIELSALQSGIQNAVMRIAIRKLGDGSFHYALGFDDAISAQDIQFKSEGIDLVASPESLDLGRKLVIDFVELDSGEKNFIFINPDDPNYSISADQAG